MSEEMNPQVVQRLMHHLIEIEQGRITCPEAFALLDEYADLCCLQKETELPLVHNHLHQCPECLAFCQALLAIIQRAEDETPTIAA